MQKFRTGSRASTGFDLTEPEHTRVRDDPAQRGLPNTNAAAREDLVEKLLEAEGEVKPDLVTHDAAQLPHRKRGTVLHVEV